MDNPFPEIMFCPNPLPADLHIAAQSLADAWINSDHRPRVTSPVLSQWSRLIEERISNEALPLYIRKARRNRGSEIIHVSGRKLVPCDNSVAHWIYALSIAGICPSISKIAEFVCADKIPVAMALPNMEKEVAKYKCSKQPVSLNELGWKICHIDSVGLKSQGELTKFTLEQLVDHFRKYASPNNMFLVPKIWSGLGELPEMIDAARRSI